MSTLTEIQDAVAKLSPSERKALMTWLASESEPDMTVPEEQQLLQSLEEAIRDVDSGKGISMADARKRVASWVAK
jgi:hypothetical protein